MLEKKGVRVSYFLNNNNKLDTLHNLKVYTPDEENTKNVFIVVAVSHELIYYEVAEQLKAYGLREFENYTYYTLLFKKIVLLHGNCHIGMLASILSLSKEFQEQYAIYPNPLICDNPSGKIEDTGLQNCDVWIHQDIRTNNPYGYYLSDEYVRTSVRGGAKEIIFPNLYSFGKAFFPQSNLSNTLSGPIKNGEVEWGMFMYSDWVIDQAASEGKTVDEILQLVQSDEVLEKEFILKTFNDNMEKIREREPNWDIKIYDFIMQNYKSKKLFHDLVHPTNVIMKKMALDVLQMLGITITAELEAELEQEPEYQFGHLNQEETPMYPVVKKVLGMEYEEERYIRDGKEGKKCMRMDMEEYVREYLWYCHNYKAI
jgi:hypothetical protein